MNYEITVDENKLERYIIRRLKEMGSKVSEYEVKLVLQLEFEHLQEIGAISE